LNIDAQQRRVREIAVIKAALAAVVLVIMIITFPRPLALLVAAADVLLVPVYVLLARRYPVLATYLLAAETALALTPRQFLQGYVNGINWVFYLPLPLAAAYVIGSRRSIIHATIVVLVVALPVILLAALTLPAQITRAEVLTLIAYLVVVLVGLAWIGNRLLRT
jgi:hypothetical protein